MLILEQGTRSKWTTNSSYNINEQMLTSHRPAFRASIIIIITINDAKQRNKSSVGLQALRNVSVANLQRAHEA